MSGHVPVAAVMQFTWTKNSSLYSEPISPPLSFLAGASHLLIKDLVF